MKEIVNRLHENRQIELARSILESNGYKVTKKLGESLDYYEDGYAYIDVGVMSDVLQNTGDYDSEFVHDFCKEYSLNPKDVELYQGSLELENITEEEYNRIKASIQKFVRRFLHSAGLTESDGSKKSKRLKEDAKNGIISNYVSQLSAEGDRYTLETLKDINLENEFEDENGEGYYASRNIKVLDYVTKLLGNDPKKIYVVDSEDYEDELTHGIYRDVLELEYTRVRSKEIYGDGEDNSYWATVQVCRLKDTGEEYVSVSEQWDDGSMIGMYFFK